ncbi:DUF3375 family protein [Streptomyces sp. CG4]|uniref:DUF3375 family protein n=1 Tax=Streptomyces sp. CG4 TaxID=408783 RepID=UPI0034E1D991
MALSGRLAGTGERLATQVLPSGLSEPHYDATVPAEKAISWVRSLQERSAVGTESRLKTISDLLQQTLFGAESAPDARLPELMQPRHDIEKV